MSGWASNYDPITCHWIKLIIMRYENYIKYIKCCLNKTNCRRIKHIIIRNVLVATHTILLIAIHFLLRKSFFMANWSFKTDFWMHSVHQSISAAEYWIIYNCIYADRRDVLAIPNAWHLWQETVNNLQCIISVCHIDRYITSQIHHVLVTDVNIPNL